MEKYDYTKDDITQALKKSGIHNGDNIFVHSNLGFFGKLLGVNDAESYWSIYKEAIFNVLGTEGTLIVPTFTYSFCWNKIFDKEKTPSTVGIFSEFVRNDPESFRSEDGNFSVAAIGANAEYLTKDAPEHSFGQNSFWERLLNVNGIICGFNVGIMYNTFIHYVEKLIAVPYRYDKKFPGKSMKGGKLEDGIFIHFVRNLDDSNTEPDLTELSKKAKELGLIKESNLGKGQISCISARSTLDIIQSEIKKNPNFLIRGSYLQKNIL